MRMAVVQHDRAGVMSRTRSAGGQLPEDGQRGQNLKSAGRSGAQAVKNTYVNCGYPIRVQCYRTSGGQASRRSGLRQVNLLR